MVFSKRSWSLDEARQLEEVRGGVCVTGTISLALVWCVETLYGTFISFPVSTFPELSVLVDLGKRLPPPPPQFSNDYENVMQLSITKVKIEVQALSRVFASP